MSRITTATRRDFLRTLGLGTAAVPFILNLPSLAFANQTRRKQRLVIMFSPNGVIPDHFWPERRRREVHAQGKPQAACSVSRSAAHTARRLRQGPRRRRQPHARHRLPAHRRGTLTPATSRAAPTRPPAGPAASRSTRKSSSILQQDAATRTRFGSLEFGVMVPDRADTWTRMVYAGANKPVAPIDDPYQMFAKLYGKVKDREMLASVLDDVQDDLKKVRGAVSSDDRRLLDEHATFVREMEQELRTTAQCRPCRAPARSGREARERSDSASQQDADRPDGE